MTSAFVAFLLESDVVDGMQVLRGCVTDVQETDKPQTLLATCCSGWRRRRRRLCSAHHAASAAVAVLGVHQERACRPPRLCSVSCTPSVHHDVMARRQWTSPCVRSRSQSASSESDSDTSLLHYFFFLDISCIWYRLILVTFKLLLYVRHYHIWIFAIWPCMSTIDTYRK